MLCAQPKCGWPCGKCPPCQINRRKLWTGRMLLELAQHPASCFVTLTFAEGKVPDVWDATEWQLFAKRLRFYRGPFRYYAVGERGSVGGRPHYHAALFGVSLSETSNIVRAWQGHDASTVFAVPKESVGGVHVGELNDRSAAYLLKYMCKDDDSFAMMSRRPYGIGAKAMDDVASEILRGEGSSVAVAESGDVPTAVRFERARLPLGRYLRGKLRRKLGEGERTPQAVLRALGEARSREDRRTIAARSAKRKAVAANVEARVRIFRSKEKLK